MIIGRSAWGYSGNVFKISPCITNINTLKVQNAIFDEVKVDGTVSEIYSSIKDEWNYDTVLLATFDGTLEAGDINNNGIPIQKILFQKRKTEDYEWTTVVEFDYNSTRQLYEFLDTYVQNFCPYEFCVVPLTSTVTGDRVTKSITPTFEGCFLTDKNTNIHLLLNLNLSDFENVQGSYIYEPIGGEGTPIIGYSSLDYVKFPIKSLVMSDTSIQQNDINPYTEKKYRDKILNFLKNHKPKLFRASNSEFMIINITGNPKFAADINLLEGTIGDISCEAAQVEKEINNITLSNNGFI